MDIMKVKDEQGNWVTVPAFQGQLGKTPSFSIGRVDLGTTPSSAAATITGTDEAPILNLVLPKGITGDIGPTGIAVQDTEPSGTLAWIDTSSTGNLVSIPEVKDNVINTTDTWSSAKIRDFIYPVGSIYLSVNNINPSTIFGGTWEQIQDTFLLAAGNTYTAGTTGGNSNHSHTTEVGTTGGTAITVEQMPWHGHQVRLHNNAGTTGTAYYYNGATKTNSTGAQSPSLTWKGTTFNAAQGGAGDQVGGADPVGGGQPHTHSQTSVNTSLSSNMPPYLAVYMWKRLS